VNSALILASASPRRLDLLRQLGIEPVAIEKPLIDETPRRGELPAAYARRIAHEKLMDVASRPLSVLPKPYILAADTVVACGRQILPKAEDPAMAAWCLDRLSGRRHRVLGGIAIMPPTGKIAARLVTTSVLFKRLSPEEIRAYIAGGEWQGKAGGYAIQGQAAAFIPAISGSYSNVVGLALYDLMQMLKGLGFKNQMANG